MVMTSVQSYQVICGNTIHEYNWRSIQMQLLHLWQDGLSIGLVHIPPVLNLVQQIPKNSISSSACPSLHKSFPLSNLKNFLYVSFWYLRKSEHTLPAQRQDSGSGRGPHTCTISEESFERASVLHHHSKSLLTISLSLVSIILSRWHFATHSLVKVLQQSNVLLNPL